MGTKEEGASLGVGNGAQEIMKEIVLGLIISPAERVLVCRRYESDVWMLPGGNIEPGEEPCDAMEREIEEELGWDVDCTIDDRVLDMTAPGPKGVYRYCLYAIRYAELLPDIVNVSHPEFAEVRWVTPSEMDAMLLTPACRVLYGQIEIDRVIACYANHSRHMM